MGYGEVWVYRDRLKGSGKGFDDAMGDMTRIWDRLHSRVAAEGECWGKDATGKAVESKIKEPSQTAENSFKEMPKRLKECADAVREMGLNHDKAEEASGG